MFNPLNPLNKTPERQDPFALRMYAERERTIDDSADDVALIGAQDPELQAERAAEAAEIAQRALAAQRAELAQLEDQPAPEQAAIPQAEAPAEPVAHTAVDLDEYRSARLENARLARDKALQEDETSRGMKEAS